MNQNYSYQPVYQPQPTAPVAEPRKGGAKSVLELVFGIVRVVLTFLALGMIFVTNNATTHTWLSSGTITADHNYNYWDHDFLESMTMIHDELYVYIYIGILSVSMILGILALIKPLKKIFGNIFFSAAPFVALGIAVFMFIEYSDIRATLGCDYLGKYMGYSVYKYTEYTAYFSDQLVTSMSALGVAFGLALTVGIFNIKKKPAPVQQPYGAPVQQQYAAPVQQPYGAPVQQQYAAPVQEQYAAPVQEQSEAPVANEAPAEAPSDTENN